MDVVEWWQAFKLGDLLAEKFFFNQFFKPLCLYADNLIQDLPAAEDIVTELFVKAFDRRTEFKEPENMKAFLYASVRNASYNFNLKEKRKKTTFEGLVYVPGFETSVMPNLVQNEILLAEIIQAIHQEIEALPDKCGIIFKKIFFENLTTEVIANQLDINPQTVRTQKARAIQLIKTSLLKKKELSALGVIYFLDTMVSLII